MPLMSVRQFADAVDLPPMLGLELERRFEDYKHEHKRRQYVHILSALPYTCTHTHAGTLSQAHASKNAHIPTHTCTHAQDRKTKI